MAVVIWYDKQFRTWVVQCKDDKDNQVGDAIYVYTKREAELVAQQLKQQK